MNDLDHLDLIELMDPEQAPGVGSIAPGLPAETGAEGGHLNRQRLELDERVPVQVGDRHFAGRDQEQIIHFTVIQIFGKLG